MMDLKNRVVNIVALWPDFMQNKEEMLEIAKAVSTELHRYHVVINQTYRNFFVETTDEKGIERFEKLYNIVPRADATLEDRQFAVLTKMQTKVPYTKRRLNELLMVLLGDGQYALHIDTSNYIVKVQVELTRKNQVDAIADLLRRVIPANMGYTVQVKYNQYYLLTKFTYAELKKYTYQQLKDDPAIKEIYLDRGGTIL